MEIRTQIQTPDESRSVTERIFNENMTNKITGYINKFDGDDVEGDIILNIDKDKKGLFKGVLRIGIDGKSYRYEREEYKNLVDLINHLFDKFKEELSKS